MNHNTYVVAAVKPWNIKIYNEKIKHYPGVWRLITEPEQLAEENIKRPRPEYIFFPHWNHIVPDEILAMTNCVCFHETDLPYGRGGSPIQNLIARGHKETMITALKMTSELDAGPVYLKRPLSLEGLAEEIFIRSSHIVAEMIKTIIMETPDPIEQAGEPFLFKRRVPTQSKVPLELDHYEELFDHVRMLDAFDYPRAYIVYGGFKYELSRPSLRTDGIHADVHITKLNGDHDD